MKTRNLILCALMALIFNGCLIKSIHPFFKEKDVIFRKELIGTWLDQDSGVWKISQNRIDRDNTLFNQDQKDSLLNNYEVTFTEKNQTAVFRVHLFKLNGQQFVDFFPEEIKTPELTAFHLIRAHSIAKIEVTADSISLKWFNEIWLAGLFENNKIRISHETILDDQNDKNYVLTASTDELQKFLIKYGNDPKAFTSKSFDPKEKKEILCFTLKRTGK